ncbi:Ca2+-binding RTX toxin-like protein [Inhella inkyongensis]|uniref:Ca2+-binding RTX toxin-like protein n=1 Tax=Inhella inkyongensis TaxID=392593 RepID=A0A840SDN1_9BURK|nr:calcium-binding protein [Inhella inkyongensis]MBB5206399.1 Ca2+-binding RTX toxin-like protein [Inhella inkyongensis]
MGGGGDDALFGANDNDRLHGEVGDDLLIGEGGDDELVGGAGLDSISGGDGRDRLDGGAEADFLVGGMGADVLLGGAGHDLLLGDAPYQQGNTVAPFYPVGLDVGAMGGDLLDGGSGNDTLFGNHGDDGLFGGADDDLLWGGEGQDRLFGDAGADELVGGLGDDHLDGGADNDVLYGDEGDDVLQGGAGVDTLLGGTGHDRLEGGLEADQLLGGEGDDVLLGGAGNDILIADDAVGPGGNDTLEGGAGNETLQGGSGSDVYVFRVGDGLDTVSDVGSGGARNVIAFKMASTEVRTLRRDGLDLVIEYGSSDRVTVADFYGQTAFGVGYAVQGAAVGDEGAALPSVAEIRFEDGTVWGVEDILTRCPAPPPSELPPDPLAGQNLSYFLSALLSREQVSSAGKKELTFSFSTLFDPAMKGVRLYSEEQKQAVREALGRFSAVLDVRFVELSDGRPTDLSFYLDDLSSQGMEAFAGYANAQTGQVHLSSRLFGQTRKDEYGRDIPAGSLNRGEVGFQVLLHEIGHALGLKHPFEHPVLPGAEDRVANTVMSYTHSATPATDLGPFDIAALQVFYGVAPSLHAGNDTHVWGERWLQDSGGIDILDASAQSQGVSINLTPGSWIYRGSQATSILADQQAFIGFGTQIEDAFGGAGDDRLVGNALANVLDGGAGADSLSGGAGDDLLRGGEGADQLEGGAGADTLDGGQGADVYRWSAASENDVVRDLGSGADQDVLRLLSVASFEGLSFSSRGNDVVLVLPGGKQLVLEGQRVGQGVEFIEIDGGIRLSRAELVPYIDAIRPSAGSDLLRGGAGPDVIDGLAGDDRIEGGAGDDRLIGGAGLDTVIGGAGHDWLDAETADGGAGNDTLSGGVTGTMAAGLQGGTGSDTFDLRRLERGAAMVFEEVDGGSATATDIDTLLLPATFTLANLQADFYASGDLAGADDIRLGAHGQAGDVYLRNVVRADGSTAGVERLVLSDGQVLGVAELRRLVQGQITEGRDRWYGTSGADRIDMQAGDDYLYGRGGNDTLIGGGGDDTLDGGVGDDQFVAQAGSGFDHLKDEAGTDAVKFTDALSGQVGLYRHGDDLWIYRTDDLRAQLRVEGHFRPGWNGAGAIERIEFADGSSWQAAEFAAHLVATPPDHLNLSFDDAGDGGDQLIKGNSGNNRLSSFTGADSLMGGDGDDFYDIDTGTLHSANTIYGTDDVVLEQPGGGRDTLRARHWDVTLPEHVENLIHKFEGTRVLDHAGKPVPAQLKGNALDNHLSVEGLSPIFGGGLAPAYWFDGGVGADTMVGGQSNDTYVVDNPGDRVLDAGVGDLDTVRSSVSYSLGESIENLELVGAAAKRGEGNARANVIRASGNAGVVDTLLGGAGDDEYWIDGDERIVEEAQGGNDTVKLLGAGAHKMADYAHVEAAVLLSPGAKLTGTDAGETLRQGETAWATELYGMGGDDRLEGGTSSVLSGGAGNDSLRAGGTVLWNVGDGHDQLELIANTTIRLGADVALGDLALRRDGRALVIEHAGSPAMTVQDYFAEPVGSALKGFPLWLEVLDGRNRLTFSWSQLDGVLTADANSLLRLGTSGSDTLVGGAAQDTLAGGSGADHLEGGTGPDYLLGESGDDTLMGGAGDRLSGGAGSDHYQITELALGSAGLGLSVEDREGAQDVIELPPGVTPDTLALQQSGNSLQLLWNAGRDGLTVQDYFAPDADSIERLRFASGQSWTRDDIETRLARWMVGGEGDDYFEGSEGRDGIRGLGGNDSLLGAAGHDTLEGGAGDDTLQGGAGDDLYLFSAGHGQDLVDDLQGQTIIRFDATVKPADVAIREHSIQFGLGSEINFVHLLGSPGIPVSRVEFADGTVWTGEQLRHVPGMGTRYDDYLFGTQAADLLQGLAGSDSLSGGAGNDTLVGGVGNDELSGGEGDDVFVYNPGDGFDSLMGSWALNPGDDVLRFGAGIDPSEVTLALRGPYFVFVSTTGGDLVRVSRQADGLIDGLSRVEFDNGSSWTRADLDRMARPSLGSEMDDHLFGGEQADTLRGLGGNDTLEGAGGDDVLEGGEGDDFLQGGNGDDTLVGGDGGTVFVGGAGNDVYVVNLAQATKSWVSDGVFGSTNEANVVRLTGMAPTDVAFSRSGNSLMVQRNDTNTWVAVENWFSDGDMTPQAETFRFEFDGGLVLTASEAMARLHTTKVSPQADIWYGSAGADTVHTGAGDDFVEGAAGADALNGGMGADWVDGGEGNDILRGDEGNDQLLDSQDRNLLDGGPGEDEITMGLMSNVIIGGQGNDTLFGGNDPGAVSRGGSLVLMNVGDGHDLFHQSEQDGATDTISLGGARLADLTLTSTLEGVRLQIAGDTSLTLVASSFTPRRPLTLQLVQSGQILSFDLTAVLADFQSALSANPAPVNWRMENSLSSHALGTSSTQAIGGVVAYRYALDGNLSALSDARLQLALASTGFGTSWQPISDSGDIIGSSGNDSLTGTSANDRLFGLAGHDVLDGGVGADTLEGGAGDDRYVVDSAADQVVEQADEGLDSVLASVDWVLGDHIESLELFGSAHHGTGNAQANRLLGGAGSDSLLGLGGADTLDGGAGADQLVGGSGDDVYLIDHTGDLVQELASEGQDHVIANVSYSLSTGVEALTLSGSADLSATGNELPNHLTGNAGNNRLDGSLGLDTLEGGAGNDVYVVNMAGEVVTELSGGGTDTVESSVTWTLGAELENLVLNGTAAIHGTGNGLANRLTGNAGNNRLDGGVGADTLEGGQGNDSYVIDSLADVVIEQVGGGTDIVESLVSLTLGAELETLVLKGSANLNGTGNDLGNTLTGNAGANRLDGGAGADTMSGGAGNDVYAVDNVGDRVSESAAGGMDTVEASVNWTLGAEIESLLLTGSANLAGTGNAAANSLTGNAGSNRLNGMGGADTMRGGMGDDIYVVDVSADQVIEDVSAGTDTVEAALTWTLGANLENLTLTGSAAINGTGNGAANTLLGNAAANVLTGGGGNDVLDGKAGADSLLGGAGDDFYVVDLLTDVVTEKAGEGVDTVQAGVSWTLAAEFENLVLSGTASLQGTGNAGDNQLTGNTAANTLKGAEGKDSLDGGAGNDNLDGGVGNDLLRGGAGADIYVFGRGWGSDTIVESDATAGIKDSVNFASGVALGDVSFVRNGNALELRIAGSPADLLTIKDWYVSSANKVEEFRFVGGAVLTAAQAESKATTLSPLAAWKAADRALRAGPDLGMESAFTVGFSADRWAEAWSWDREGIDGVIQSLRSMPVDAWVSESSTKKVALPQRDEFAEAVQQQVEIDAPGERKTWEPLPDARDLPGERLTWEPVPDEQDPPGVRLTWESLPESGADEALAALWVALPERRGLAGAAPFNSDACESRTGRWAGVDRRHFERLDALELPDAPGAPRVAELEWLELLRGAGSGCRTGRARDEAERVMQGMKFAPGLPTQQQADALVQAMAGFAGGAGIGLASQLGGHRDSAHWNLAASPLP